MVNRETAGAAAPEFHSSPLTARCNNDRSPGAFAPRLGFVIPAEAGIQ